MGWDLIAGGIALMGSTIATLTATEGYFQKKFERAVRAVLAETGFDAGKIQDISSEVERCKRSDIRLHAQVQALAARIEKVAIAVRILADEEEERRSISAIFDSTEGTPE